MVRQLENHSSTDPIVGATIGASPRMMPIQARMCLRRGPSYRSRQIAMHIDDGPAAPIPCRMRKAINCTTLVARAQATDAAANRASPASSTGRRPCLSDSGPQTSKNTLKLANQSTSDSATRLSGTPHRFAMIGIAARYISVASAGTVAMAAKNIM